MLREKRKWRPHKRESTNAGHGGGSSSSSVEGSVMELERRGKLAHISMIHNFDIQGKMYTIEVTLFNINLASSNSREDRFRCRTKMKKS